MSSSIRTRIVAGMQYQRDRHSPRALAHIDLQARTSNHRLLTRFSLQLVEESMSSSDPSEELRREHLPERAVVGARSSKSLLSNNVVDARLAQAALQRLREGHSTRWLTRSGWQAYSRSRALKSDQREALELRGIHHRLEIVNPRLERDLRRVAIGQPAAARVVSHISVMARKGVDPVAPDGTAPVEFEVRQPVRGLHEGRAATPGGVGEPHSVGAVQKRRVWRSAMEL